MSLIDVGPGAGLSRLLVTLGAAVSASPRDVLGHPMAIGLRYEKCEDGFFLSGVRGDLVELVSDAFGTPVLSGSTGLAVAEQHWRRRGANCVGSGPVNVSSDVGDQTDALVSVRRIAFGLPIAETPTLLGQARALRERLHSASAILSEDLSTPPDFGYIVRFHTECFDDFRAVVADVAASREFVGRYLLDAADLFDDERIDQLGDGYVRLSSLWSTFAVGGDPSLGETIMSLERECVAWMARAAEPPTRYAF